jgi:hypothetical protein
LRAGRTQPAVQFTNSDRSYWPEPSEAEGDGEGDDSGSELGLLFFSSDGDGEASVLAAGFFFAVVEDEDEADGLALVVAVFFLAVVEVLDALVVPDFFVVAVVAVDFLPVEAVALGLADSFLCAQDTKKTPATRMVMKEKTVFFIGFVTDHSLFSPAQNRKHFRLFQTDFEKRAPLANMVIRSEIPCCLFWSRAGCISLNQRPARLPLTA